MTENDQPHKPIFGSVGWLKGHWRIRRIYVCLIVFFAQLFGWKHYNQARELISYREQEQQARELVSSANAVKIPNEGYMRYLEAEQQLRNRRITYMIDDHTFHYEDSFPSTFWLAIRSSNYLQLSGLVELDSADLAYFHKKALARVEIERKDALLRVNQHYDLLKQVDKKQDTTKTKVWTW